MHTRRANVADVTEHRIECVRAEALLASLPDASVNLIATDPPYHGVKSDAWDRQWKTDEDFLAWIDGLCAQWKRVLTANGSLYVFAAPRMGARVECVVRKHLNVLTNIRWRKPPHSTKAEMFTKEDLRAPFPSSETVVFAAPNASSAVEYLKRECAQLGITPAELSRRLGFRPTPGSIGPRRYLSASGFAPMSREHYALLQSTTGGFARPYDDVYRPFFATKDRPYTDVWDFATVQGYQGKHVCEKPADMGTHIVQSSSRPGDVVADFFSGSGTFPAAAAALGRKVIACDMDEHWTNITRDRVARSAASGKVEPAIVGRQRKVATTAAVAESPRVGQLALAW